MNHKQGQTIESNSAYLPNWSIMPADFRLQFSLPTSNVKDSRGAIR